MQLVLLRRRLRLFAPRPAELRRRFLNWGSRRFRPVGLDHHQPVAFQKRFGIDLRRLDPGRGFLDARRSLLDARRGLRRRQSILGVQLILARKGLTALVFAQLVFLYRECRRGGWPLLAPLAMAVAPVALSATALAVALPRLLWLLRLLLRPLLLLLRRALLPLLLRLAIAPLLEPAMLLPVALLVAGAAFASAVPLSAMLAAVAARLVVPARLLIAARLALRRGLCRRRGGDLRLHGRRGRLEQAEKLR